jgi:flagellar basal body-associated protein FliL
VREVNKKGLMIVLILIAVLAITAVAPAFAAKPTVNDDVWFVAAGMAAPSVPGKTWWTGDDTVLHNKGQIQPNWQVFRSPSGTPPGSVPIGSMTTVAQEFVFNTKSGKGRLIMKITITFSETNPTKNPYGVGTLEGTVIVEVTSLHSATGYAGDGTGFIVATHGTEAFENAKLTADLLVIPAGPGLFIFFGTHPNVGGSGIIVYH